MATNEQSIGGGEHEDCIDLADKISLPAHVVTRDCREDPLIPERQTAVAGSVSASPTYFDSSFWNHNLWATTCASPEAPCC